MFFPVKEDFLHYLWRTKKLHPNDLVTTDGLSVSVMDYGTYNLDSGPDFFNAKIELDNTIWVGNIEMHVFTSDWTKHGHSKDRAYDNVILHVVYEHDKYIQEDPVLAKIPILELKGKIPRTVLDSYLALMQSVDEIPCQRLIKNVNPTKIELWKHTLMVDRLLQKANQTAAILYHEHNDWEETFYILLARYFGSKVNKEPFGMLAMSLPWRIILKNRDKPLSVEALVFGQAGMLEANYTDDYFVQLREEFRFLRQKYELTPINPVAWKFSKMRPINFPTVRLAQFAAVIQQSNGLFSKVLEATKSDDLRQILRAEPHSYWDNHYRFGKESPVLNKAISNDFIDLLIINTLAPILCLYGRSIDNKQHVDKAIHWIESLNAENNHIVQLWKKAGIKVKSAFDSQSLIHLKTQYCDLFKCLQCTIGHEIVGEK